MSTLRQLLVYLLALDCVAFNQYLETVVSSSGGGTKMSGAFKAHPSPWLYLPAAEHLIAASRKRVYLKESEVPKAPSAEESNQANKEKGASGVDEEAEDEEAAYWKEFEPTAEEEAEALRIADVSAGQPRASTPENGAHKSPKPKKWWEDLHVKPVLEQQPKWELLSEVLDEVENDLHLHPSQPSGL